MRAVEIENIAGVVILYNSSIETIDNIETYINQIHKLYVVDNSDRPNSDLIDRLKLYPNIHYQSLNGNRGIATALNWAAKQAIQDKFAVLLTMDDDTRTPAKMVTKMVSFWNNYPKAIGILSGVHHLKPDTTPYRTLLYTLTSGNILNLEAYKAIGNFRDDFFIDHVDHEYGLRLNANGYQVIELPAIRLDHQLGYEQKIKIGPWVVRKYGTHSPIRMYYFARNGIYTARIYLRTHPSFAWMVVKEIAKRWIKALLLDKDRTNRVNMLIQGVKDGWKSRLGQYIR